MHDLNVDTLSHLVVSGIASIADGAQLELFIETASGAELERLTTVILEQGDVIVMRGDMIHAGAASPDGHFARVHAYLDIRSEERRVGKECVSTCRSRW